MSDFMKELKKINPMAEILDESTLGNISEYISTGSLSLNGIISGSIFKGIPAGRVTAITGESGTGKSYICGRIAANAQKNGYDVIYFDSENAITKNFLGNLGVDTSKLLYLPVETLEEFKNQAFQILKTFEEKYFEQSDKKIIIILDSLGNLPAEKELRDVDNQHNASDMGLRAKVIKSMTRVLTTKLAKLNVPLVLTNHTYAVAAANPMAAPTEVPTGGRGVIYLSTVIAHLSKTKIKEVNEEGGPKKTTGNILKADTTKNRIVPEGQRAEMKVNLTTGPLKYFGLLKPAIRYGLIKKDGSKYVIGDLEKKYWEAELYAGGRDGKSVDELWGPILNKLDDEMIANNKFSSIADGYDDEVITRYYLYHSESECIWIVYSKEELDIALESDGLVSEISKDEYDNIKSKEEKLIEEVIEDHPESNIIKGE